MTLQSKDERNYVTRVLSTNAYSTPWTSTAAKRADGAQLPSNMPCEDRFNPFRPFPLWGEEDWIVGAIFDGHSGSQLAVYLEEHLLKSLQERLDSLGPPSRTDDIIQSTIEKCFTDMDDSIIEDYRSCTRKKRLALSEKIRIMQRAMAGSCALVTLYNPATRTLYTACTGDSRAVLSVQKSDGTWDAIALSEDQGASNEAEHARVRAEHPGELGIIKDGRLMGLGVCRAFGNFPLKSTYEEQLELGKRFMANKPDEEDQYLTPPYLTAKPVVTIRKLEDQQSAFLVMGCDGLWDNCENWEVTDLVVRWLEEQPECRLREMGMTLVPTPDTVWWKQGFLSEITYAPGFDFLERWNLFDVRFRSERTVIEDLDNVAVHLLRNACGGDHEELLSGKLAFQPPGSRLVRDDMTIQVLFF
ncbi:hypothetical protein NLG97_g10014 [Lecanicillium saksenae]|uniref:Uncharacterized protein n=1 Tax=Lecanicillium saksenae TaxID=468837 RepID=A0ACC1QEL4_9HYPO|nr:hypothetical protein NLG97_g10014 [Lecanicillium saksenae]